MRKRTDRSNALPEPQSKSKPEAVAAAMSADQIEPPNSPFLVDDSDLAGDSSSLPSSSAAANEVSVPDVRAANPSSRCSPAATKRRKKQAMKKPMSAQNRAAAQQKLAVLRDCLQPVPFSPATQQGSHSFDVAAHEPLFRALGLWDFAHIDFALDGDINVNLLAELVAFFDRSSRLSFVSGSRIRVSRADLARAISLPVKKDKPFFAAENDVDFGSEAAVSAILEFMSIYVLFKFDVGDACILPDELMTVTQLIKEGKADKVDWAGLMWSFVEKELEELPKTGICYYASHLQRLMKHQKPRLFDEVETTAPVVSRLETIPEVDIEVETSIEFSEGAEEDTRDLRDMEPLGTGIALDASGLGIGMECIDGEASNGSGGSGGSEDEAEDGNYDNNGNDNSGFVEINGGNIDQWGVGEKNDLGFVLGRCDSFRSMNFDSLGENDGFGGKNGSFRLNSTDLLQPIDTDHAHTSYGADGNVHDLSSTGFFGLGIEVGKGMGVDAGGSSSCLFATNGKRQLGDINLEDDGQIPFSGHNQQKRLRSTESWEHDPSDGISLIEHSQSFLEKAMKIFVQKEQALSNAQMNLQFMNNMLQEKEQAIDQLQKARVDEKQRYQSDLARFEHEMNVMAQMVLGYKKALKQARASFAEYRKIFPQGEKPYYGDAGGNGGLVLSRKELERLRVEKERQIHALVAEKFSEFLGEQVAKFQQYELALLGKNERMDVLCAEVRRLREHNAKARAKEMASVEATDDQSPCAEASADEGHNISTVDEECAEDTMKERHGQASAQEVHTEEPDIDVEEEPADYSAIQEGPSGTTTPAEEQTEGDPPL